MIRTCNGSDDDLTHQIPATAYDPRLHTLSSWNQTARAGYVIIRCTCGLTFDDKDRTVTHPHTPFVPHRQPLTWTRHEQPPAGQQAADAPGGKAFTDVKVENPGQYAGLR